MPATTLSSLPIEILSHIYRKASTPTDYAQLMQTSSLFNEIGRAPYVRNKFLQQLFYASRCKLSKDSNPDDRWSNMTYGSICGFIATSGVRPHSSDIRLAAQFIPTSHFINYPFPNKTVKRAVLNLFCDMTLNTSRSTVSIPALSSSPVAEASSVAYLASLTDESPRRIYYDVTLHKDTARFAQGAHFYCMFMHVDRVVAFDDDLEVHIGNLVYKDESITSTPIWEDLFDSEGCEINNVPINTISTTVSEPTSFTAIVEDLPVRTRPAPYLLRTYTGCTLRTDIRKGGLKADRKIAHVFVYEQEDDFLCVEFCDKKESKEQDILEPKGYLMFAVHDVMWQ